MRYLSLICLLAIINLYAAPIKVKVTLAEQKEFAKFTKEEVAKILKLSSEIIDKGYGKKVTFEVSRQISFTKLYEEKKKDMHPFIPPKELYYDIFNDKIDRFRKHILATTKKYGSVKEINVLLGNKKGFKTYKEQSDYLIKLYLERLNSIKQLKGLKGESVITKENWKNYSFRHWFDMINSEFFRNDFELYLCNSILLDDDLPYAAPHTLMRGGIVNGCSYMASNLVGIFYAPMLHKAEIFKSLRDGELTRNESIKAVSYIIAHEMGTHLLMQYRDQYDHKNCLSVPPKGLDYKAYIKGFKNGFDCKRKHPLERDYSPGKGMQIATVAKAQGKLEEMIYKLTDLIDETEHEEDLAKLFNSGGWCFFYKGTHDEAFLAFQEAIRLDKKVYEAHYMNVFGLKSAKEFPWNQKK